MKPGLRRRLTLLVTAVALLTVGALTAGFNLALRSSLDADASRLLQARAQVAAEAVTIADGRIRLREGGTEPAPDAQFWVYASGRELERPATATPADDALAARLAQRGGGELEDDETDLRLRAVPIRDASGHRLGVLVSAISVEPYERTAQKALAASVLFAGAIVALIGLACWLVVGRALRPVAQMTADAESWSEHDLDRRFSVGEPSDELTQLAATFDGMLDRMAGMLRHEKRFSAELSHELRTPLASIATEAELALRRERSAPEYREAVARIASKAAELAEILDTLLLAAREESSTRDASADVALVADETIRSLAELAQACGVRIETDFAWRPSAEVDPATLRRILAPVIENACAYGRATVRVDVAVRGDSAVVTVEDDGSGIDPEDAEAVFLPGARNGDGRNPAAPEGTGLGLALARRLAHAVNGEIEVIAGGAGARFEIRLPLERRA
jgi:signal transduction histidine kinase